MPKRHPPFTYIPPKGDKATMICAHCGAKARLALSEPLAAGQKGELRTFECKSCGEKTKIVFEDG